MGGREGGRGDRQGGRVEKEKEEGKSGNIEHSFIPRAGNEATLCTSGHETITMNDDTCELHERRYSLNHMPTNTMIT